ncbi:hypothetical protein JOM56_005953 [Amanita muscaria]
MSSKPERSVGRSWTDEEDNLLIEAVRSHGERDNWKVIALSVPGRTNKACRKRWLHSLSPTIRKTAWTPDEDRVLVELHEHLGPRWSAIAREIPGRTDDACSKRYREALDPSLKKDEWTREEDAKLMEVYDRVGGKWGQVSQELQRSGLACRNRWRLLERKKSHRAAQRNPVPQPAQSQISVYDPFYDPSPLLPQRDIPGLLLQTENMEGSLSPSPVNWLTFYTPEQYQVPLEDPCELSNDICLPVPQTDVQNAPFQFSSSSLSAALSDPHQFSISPIMSPHLVEERCDHGLPSSSVSPANESRDLTSGNEDQPMILCDVSAFRESLELGRIFSQVGFNSPAIHNDQSLDVNHPGPAVSPLFSPHDMTQPSALPSQGSPWTPSSPFELFGLSPIEQPHQLQQYQSMSCEESLYDEFSSTHSTPVNLLSSLSPASSPGAISPIDLPTSDPQTAGSLLFSPTQKNREPNYDTHGRPRKSVIRRALKPRGAARLSASLALTSDPSIKPYACGRVGCWPDDAPFSSACFSTSRELFDHGKNEHEFDPPGETPFRCALASCNKSWKTLNGLQYHLQISTAHFRHALSTKFSSQQLRADDSQGSVARDISSGTEASDEAQRIYVCRHPNCFKAYKQPSGLRYHLKHGHPANMPAQLPDVPPALARQLPVKAKKMRRRPCLERDAV